MTASFSILVLSLDEEENISSCLDSVSFCDDVVVLDSFSRDDTVKLASRTGARVVQRSFDSFAGQRNFAMETIPFAHPWVFHLDADERFTEPLRSACEQAVAADRHSAYFVPARVIFMGRWLRWSSLYPSYQVRLVKVGELRFTQVGHGQQEEWAARGIGTLNEPYLHQVLSRGLEEWIERHNRYSSLEAEEILDGGGRGTAGGFLSTSSPVARRRALKAMAAWMPARPALRFCYMYLFRLGFLDGQAGLAYCRLMALYERMITLKLAEGRQRTRGRRW